MFGAIGNALGKMFGTEKALTGIVEAAANGLDKLHYSDQEKAQDQAKAVTEARQMIVDWMQSTQGQNLARRLIALSITAVWLLMWLLSVVINMAAVFLESPGQAISVAHIANDAANDMNPAVMLILAFYFAAPHMGDIATAAIGKLSKGGQRKG